MNARVAVSRESQVRKIIIRAMSISFFVFLENIFEEIFTSPVIIVISSSLEFVYFQTYFGTNKSELHHWLSF